MTICACRGQLLQEATGIRRGRSLKTNAARITKLVIAKSSTTNVLKMGDFLAQDAHEPPGKI